MVVVGFCALAVLPALISLIVRGTRVGWRKLDANLIWLGGVGIAAFLSFPGPTWLPSEPLVLLVLLSAPFFARRLREVVRRPVPLSIAVLAALFALSAIWAPDPKRALGLAAAAACVGVLVSVASDLVADKPTRATTLLWLLAPAVVALSMSVAVFRFVPAWEWEYLAGPGASVLLGDQIPALLREEISVNVTDPVKAGGVLFLNANRASMVLAVIALLYVAWGLYFRKRGLIAIGLVAGTAVLFTGSKTPLLLAVVLGAAGALGIVWAATTLSRRTRIALGIVIGLTVGAGVAAIVTVQPLRDAIISTLLPRRALWTEALTLIASNPFLGVGAGGWERYWPTVADEHGYSSDYPPHNFLLWIGTQLGIVGIVVASFIVVSIITLAVLAAKGASTGRQRAALVLVAVLWAWIACHGLGDNTFFYGTMQTAMFGALGYALVVYSSRREQALPCSECEPSA